MRREEPAAVVTFPLTFTKMRVQEAPAGTVTFPLIVVTVVALPTVPEQAMSARADGAPARSVVATAITKASTDRIRLIMSALPSSAAHFLRVAQSVTRS